MWRTISMASMPMGVRVVVLRVVHTFVVDQLARGDA
jgi:hypothetical protein